MLIIFDLDGTLVDSSQDLTISVNAMLEHFHRSPLTRETVQQYVGNGAAVLVRRALGDMLSANAFEEGFAFFLEHYSKHALDNTFLYPGIRGLLDELRSMDHRMAVLSNKPARLSQDILNGLDAGKYFFRVYGGDSFPTKKPEPAGLLNLLNEAAVPSPEALFIGDSSVDVETAHNAGVRCCGVLWGFQPQRLQTAGAEILISEPHQLFAYI